MRTFLTKALYAKRACRWNVTELVVHYIGIAFLL